MIIFSKFKKLHISCLVMCALMVGANFAFGQKVPNYLKDYKKEYQQNPRAANMHWFKDAKFGLFIHYGLYSQLGRGEWAMLNDTIPIPEYKKLKDSFTAQDFNADEIVKLVKKAGMKYITITAKHHEGFCLFKTAQTDYNSLNSPAKRDLIAEMAKACEKGGIGLFLYYSYAADWVHPYFYPREAGWVNARPAYKTKPAEYLYQKPEDFKKYVAFVHAQLTELLTQYPTVAGIWFDPVMGFYKNPDFFPIAETYALIRKLSPHALISFKQGANGDEDYVAPEHSVNNKTEGTDDLSGVIYNANKNKLREVCTTLQSSSWGYKKSADGKHKTAAQIRKMMDEAEKGKYNLLLNVGPLPQGAIHPEDIESLSNVKNK